MRIFESSIVSCPVSSFGLVWNIRRPRREINENELITPAAEHHERSMKRTEPPRHIPSRALAYDESARGRSKFPAHSMPSPFAQIRLERSGLCGSAPCASHATIIFRRDEKEECGHCIDSFRKRNKGGATHCSIIHRWSAKRRHEFGRMARMKKLFSKKARTAPRRRARTKAAAGILSKHALSWKKGHERRRSAESKVGNRCAARGRKAGFEP